MEINGVWGRGRFREGNVTMQVERTPVNSSSKVNCAYSVKGFGEAGAHISSGWRCLDYRDPGRLLTLASLSFQQDKQIPSEPSSAKINTSCQVSWETKYFFIQLLDFTYLAVLETAINSSNTNHKNRCLRHTP